MNQYECIKNVTMESDGFLAFKKGEIYVSPKPSVLFDNSNKTHDVGCMNGSDAWFNEHFKQTEEENTNKKCAFFEDRICNNNCMAYYNPFPEKPELKAFACKRLLIKLDNKTPIIF